MALVRRDNVFWKDFFEIYKNHPELWKVKSEGYKNKIIKRKGYATLLKKYQEYDPEATEEILKRKINAIRAGFRRELRKVVKSTKIATSSDDIYKPTLWYFNDLEFLRGQEEDDNETTSLEIETTFMDSDSFPKHATSTFDEEEDPVDIEDLRPQKLSIFKPKFVSSTTKDTPTSQYTAKSSKILATEKILEDLKTICKSLQEPAETNEFDCFGASIAAQLKKLPDKAAQEAMEHIQSYLVRQRIHYAANPSSQTNKGVKKMRFDGLDSSVLDECEITNLMKEKEIELMEREHEEKLEVLKLKKRNLEQRLRFEEEEHSVKMQNLTSTTEN